MAAITVTNTDWAILDAVASALRGATIASEEVFAAVHVTASRVQFVWAREGDWPVAVVEYVTTVEAEGLDGERDCALDGRIHLAAAVVGTGVDESARIQEALRLVNAAKNAIESSLPAAADCVGAARLHARSVEWGQVALDADTNRPWVAATLPVPFGYVLGAGTAH